ncbi:hypothetical protein KC343_g5178 [Hortaea werneckii]|nr:hypothetical protein KC352_g4765 [Hortaea werneckii]KAI7572211.1 hypothetical protein KC317_g953 [Hortaea werneckii]KAI7627203.1 hypothetical protein KC346_g864 [Hortaea werneckii]KAI7629520.1 hypothetical protein KC343_g5178 [Hortaea werneckii]KAI7682693.1 hypothetical protein KC319_g862 [Hortaea werneckii]
MPDAETDRGGKFEHRRQCEHNLQESLNLEGQASQAVKESLNAIAGSYSDGEIMFGICRMHGDFKNAFVTPDGFVKKFDIGLPLKIKAQSFWPRSFGESLVGALTTQFNVTEGPYVDSDLIDSIKKAMAEVYFRLRDPPQVPIEVQEEEGFVNQTNDAGITDGSSMRQHTPKSLVRLKVSPTKAKLIASTSGDQSSGTTSHGSQRTATPQNPQSPSLPSSSSERKGHGNHAHGAQAPWTPDEIAFCKSKILEAKGNITWSQLAAACNQEFADKPVTLARGLVVQRGTRTDQSMRQRAELKECRQWAKAQAKTVVQGLSAVQEEVEEGESEERVEE